ncbi:MAG: hypothetical protein NT031_20195 [Planctomycetota bacterium]|nr:hypothetical protein [Planctomycetota bacterium]
MPRRRRRMWRYVSPRRRGIALFLLVLLGSVIVGYQVMTSDARVAAQAEQMLTEITHCPVKVKEARFGLFGGIKLKGVQISAPQGPPILVAAEVFLRHDPWQVITELTIEPTEIVLVSPVVTRVASPGGAAGSAGGGASSFQATMDQVAAWGRQRGGLPSVRITDGRFRQLVERDGQFVPMQEERLDLVGRQDENWVYRVTLGQPGAGAAPSLLGNAEWNLASGDWKANLAGFDRLLPPELKGFLDRYQVEWGQTRLEARSGKGDLGGELVLQGLAFKFPAPEGVLRVEGVSGVLSLLPGAQGRSPGIQLRNVRGRLPALAGAWVEIVAGTIDRATPDASFRLELAVKELRPHALRADKDSPLASSIEFLHRNYKPEVPRLADGKPDPAGGTVEATMEISRPPGGGPIQLGGKAFVKGMTITYRYFPYRLENVTGGVEFTQDSVLFEKKALTASAGSTRVEMTGRIDGLADWSNYRFGFRCTDVPLDERLHQALPGQPSRAGLGGRGGSPNPAQAGRRRQGRPAIRRAGGADLSPVPLSHRRTPRHGTRGQRHGDDLPGRPRARHAGGHDHRRVRRFPRGLPQPAVRGHDPRRPRHAPGRDAAERRRGARRADSPLAPGLRTDQQTRRAFHRAGRGRPGLPGQRGHDRHVVLLRGPALPRHRGLRRHGRHPRRRRGPGHQGLARQRGSRGGRCGPLAGLAGRARPGQLATQRDDRSVDHHRAEDPPGRRTGLGPAGRSPRHLARVQALR